MEIVKVRIDDRLIHGQVAAVWSLVTRATRIMVIDDDVINDPINKEALKMACPSRCKLSILSTKRAAENLLAKKYEGEKVFIVVKSPSTIKKLVCLGFVPDEVNVGNMGGKTDTIMIQKAVNITKQDIQDFNYLLDKDISVFAQMVPNDEKVSLKSLLSKD